jgi:hypothetical protein
MVSDLLAGIHPSVLVQRMRLLPQLLTQTGVPNIAAGTARLPPEWWPASRRNGGPLHVGAVAHFNVGMVARFASEYPARFRWNSHRF